MSNLSLKEKLFVKMQELNISPKRSLGQNFLISEYVVEQIFGYIERRNPAFIIEIGPGLGTLTEHLCERPIQRKLIELDRQFAQYWRQRGEDVIEDDALNLNWAGTDWPPNTLILGNLPYQIGSRLVIELSLSNKSIEHLVFMFQREVAERLMAETRTKDYGFLSVIAQTYWTMNKIVDASPEDFYPMPNVSSRVVAFKRRQIDELFDIGYINFIKEAFQFRRKYMVKSLGSYEAKLRTAMLKLDIKETVRAEELSPEVFQNIYRELKK